MKEFHVLGIDGGGSKGLMEAIIIQDVMNAATVIAHNPDRVLDIIQASKKEENRDRDLFGPQAVKDQFILEMKGIKDKDAIHPTEVFDMIIGTSVGALMAFGLVGGNVNSEGEREIMTLQEIVDFMREKTSDIWPCSSLLKGLWNSLKSCTCRLYSQCGLYQIFEERFGQTTLQSFKNKCIAAAVATRFGKKDDEDDEVIDTLEIFDTHSKSMNYPVTDVLKATSNAPVYFETPIRINQIPYVDGGLGGNCPMSQGVKRMKEIRKRSKFGTGLSIAPPRKYSTGEPNGLKFWLFDYFIKKTTDGFSFYCEYKKNHPRGTNQRIYPRSEKAKTFGISDKRVDEMIACMEEEQKSALYLNEVASAAIVIAARVVKTDGVAKLWEIAREFVDNDIKLNPRTSTAERIAAQVDNDLAIMNAMSKIELDKNSPMRHQILLKQAKIQKEAHDYDDAKETLEKINLEDDNVDTDTKDEIQSLLNDINSVEED